MTDRSSTSNAHPGRASGGSGIAYLGADMSLPFDVTRLGALIHGEAPRTFAL